MASKEKVLKLLGAIELPEEVKCLREASLHSAEEVAGSDAGRIIALEEVRRRTEAWPDDAIKMLLEAYAEEMTDEECEQFIALLASPGFKCLITFMSTATDRVESFWEWHLGQVLVAATEQFPPTPLPSEHLH